MEMIEKQFRVWSFSRQTNAHTWAPGSFRATSDVYVLLWGGAVTLPYSLFNSMYVFIISIPYSKVF